MSQNPVSPRCSGTAAATADRHLPLRSEASIVEIREMPVAFGIVTEVEDDETPPTPSRNCSFTTYDQLMRNAEEAHRIVRTAESLAELASIPNFKQVPTVVKTPTLNKKLHSQESYANLRKMQELPSSEENDSCQQRNSDYTYTTNPTISNSDYAYYPPVLCNSDYAYTAFKESVTPTNSSYCYVNADGSSRFMSTELPPKSPGNPYTHVSRYRKESSSSSSAVNVYPASIPMGEYQKELGQSRTPTKQILNKHIGTVVSETDTARLEISFTEHCVNHTECPNRRPLNTELHYGTGQSSSTYDFGLEQIRDYSIQSLEELHHLPTLSSYQLVRMDQPEEDVSTARFIRSVAITRSENNLKY